jgi:hypothetical protein
MGIGTSIVIMAAGAMMTFAVESDSAEGFNINNAGVILMIIGALGLLASLFLFGPRTRRTRTVEDVDVVDVVPAGTRRRTVYRDDVA